MGAYCQIADVLYAFPRFQTGLPNNISNTGIQSWIDEGKAEIRARFLRRGLDPDNPPSLGWSPPLTVLTTDQANVLRKFNVAYAIMMFGDVAMAQMSDGELGIAKRAEKFYRARGRNTDAAGERGKGGPWILGNDGVYDALFTPNAVTVQVGPQVGGWAGADFGPEINNYTQGTWYPFTKYQLF